MRKGRKIGRILCGVMTAVTVIGPASLPAFAETAESAGQNYYVSVKSGKDTNPGTTADKPFKTIQQAADVARAGDTVYIMEGEYYETVTPENNGEEGRPITFTNYKSDKVTISGTVPVDDDSWELYQSNIYKVSTDKIKNFKDLGEGNQVFVNGETMWEARWPNINPENIGSYGLEVLEAHDAVLDNADTPNTGYTGHDGYNYYDEDLKQLAGADLTGATAWCRSGMAWVASSSRVTAADPANGRISVERFTDETHNQWLYPRSGNDYYVFGALGLLDSPGEWYVDSNEKTLYLYAPDGEKPTGVTVKSRLDAIDIRDRSNIHIKGLSILGATVNMDGADDCVIDSVNMNWNYYSMECTEGYVAQDDKGLNISGNGNTIKNSTLAYGTGGAIRISGSNNNIINNDIHDFNFIGSYATGVTLKGRENLISYNSIHNVGRSAIQMEGYADIIEHNRMYNMMWRSTDGGAVYAFGNDGGNTEIRYNIISDARGENSCGIYLDNFTANYIAHHNVIYNAGKNAISTNTPCDYMLIYNNTGLGDHWHWGEFYGEEGYGSHYFNNIYTGASMNFPPDAVQGNNIFGTSVEFSDPEKGDYRLGASASNAIDKGTAVKGITGEYEGDAPDLGAYEYGSDPWKAGHDFDSPPTVTYEPNTNLQYSNLVKNSCFDMGMENWETKTGKAESVKFVQEPATHLKRGHSYKLQLGDNENGGEAEVVQVLTGLQPNTTYQLSGWVYTKADENDPSSEQAVVGVRNFGGETIETEPYSGFYKRQDITFSTGDSTTAEIYVKKITGGTDYVYADDFGVQYVGEAFQNMVNKDGWTAEAYENTELAGKAVDGDYNSQWTDTEQWGIAEINAGSAVLSPLKEIRVTSGFSGISVNWDKVEDGEKYNVYRKEGDDGQLILLAERIDSTYYRDTDIQADKDYAYAVSRVWEQSESDKVISDKVKLNAPDKEENIDFEGSASFEELFREVPPKYSTIGDFVGNQYTDIIEEDGHGKVWKLASNNQVTPGAGGGQDLACAMHHPGNYSDVVLTADIKAESSMRVSLRNEQADGDSGYAFKIDSNAVTICRRNDQGTKDVDLKSAPMPEGFKAAEWNTYEFRVEGYTISLFIEGKEIISVTDESQTCATGGIMFGGWSTTLFVDNIQIRGTETPSAALTSDTLIKQDGGQPDITVLEKAKESGSKWITVNMKDICQINRVKAYLTGGQAVWDGVYTVLISENGSDWYLAAEKIQPGTTGISAEFDAVPAQYIRIVKEDAGDENVGDNGSSGNNGNEDNSEDNTGNHAGSKPDSSDNQKNNSAVPQTGDRENVIPAVALLVASAACSGAAAFGRKYRCRHGKGAR